jgi:hypothetical protein
MPFVSVLSDSCPEYLKLSEDDKEGGFVARHIFVWGENEGRIIPDCEEVPLEILQDWTRDIDRLREVTGAMAFTHEAKSLKDDNYRKIHNERQQKHSAAELSWLQRLDTTVKKIAMIYQIQTNPADSQISADNMSKAISAGWILWKHFRKSMGLINRSNEERAGERVLAVIQKAGIIKRMDLLPRVHMNTKDLQPVLNFLEDTGKIIVEEKTNPQNKKPSFTYRAA